MMIPYIDNNYFWFPPFISPVCEKPPTLYSIMNSIVNGDKEIEDYVKIKDLAKNSRYKIFDFDYPLSDHVSKETFECTILNHYIKRRIGYDTVTNFKIMLDVKLNEIMPFYNKMFDAIDNWNIFNDGEKQTRYGYDNKQIESQSETTSDLENNSETNQNRKRSDLPQSHLENIADNSYVSEQNLDTGNDHSTSNGRTNNSNNTSDNTNYHETIEKSVGNKIEILKEFQENIQSVYSLIFKDLDCLFYGLI